MLLEYNWSPPKVINSNAWHYLTALSRIENLMRSVQTREISDRHSLQKEKEQIIGHCLSIVSKKSAESLPYEAKKVLELIQEFWGALPHRVSSSKKYPSCFAIRLKGTKQKDAFIYRVALEKDDFFDFEFTQLLVIQLILLGLSDRALKPSNDVFKLFNKYAQSAKQSTNLGLKSAGPHITKILRFRKNSISAFEATLSTLNLLRRVQMKKNSGTISNNYFDQEQKIFLHYGVNQHKKLYRDHAFNHLRHLHLKLSGKSKSKKININESSLAIENDFLEKTGSSLSAAFSGARSSVQNIKKPISNELYGAPKLVIRLAKLEFAANFTSFFTG